MRRGGAGRGLVGESDRKSAGGSGGCRVEVGSSGCGVGVTTGSSSSPSNTHKPPPKTTAKIQIEGARRVWGTMKVTTITSLRSKFFPVDSLNIKRKTVCDSDGQTKRWWFVLHASEDILQKLESKWEQIQLQTYWKLETCFMPLQDSSDENLSISLISNSESSDVVCSKNVSTGSNAPDKQILTQTSQSSATSPFLEV